MLAPCPIIKIPCIDPLGMTISTANSYSFVTGRNAFIRVSDSVNPLVTTVTRTHACLITFPHQNIIGFEQVHLQRSVAALAIHVQNRRSH